MVGVLLAAGRVALTLILPDGTIAQKVVEREAAEILLFQGLDATVQCPSGLERKVGAAEVCAYTDEISRALGALRDADARPPVREGRVKITITGFKTRGYGPSSSSDPVFSARVIDAAPTPRSRG